jgi:polysaccharide export outer membrane protein
MNLHLKLQTKNISFFHRFFLSSIAFLSLLTLSGCGAYKNSILFKTDGNIDNAKFVSAMSNAEKNYVVKKFDYLGISIFTNKGEILLDPNGEIKTTAEQQAKQQQNMSMAMGGGMLGGGMQGMGNVGGGVQGASVQFAFPRYLVNETGMVSMPIVGDVKLEGLNLYQVDSLISKTFAPHYKDVFAISRLLNRRVIVLGALGNRILSLENENMNLVEVIAMAGNLGIAARADNIRLIRNVGTKPEIQLVNLTTWEGMKAANLRVETGDIIYIEPRRRVYRQEVLQDIGSVFGSVAGILSAITAAATTILLINKL